MQQIANAAKERKTHNDDIIGRLILRKIRKLSQKVVYNLGELSHMIH